MQKYEHPRLYFYKYCNKGYLRNQMNVNIWSKAWVPWPFSLDCSLHDLCFLAQQQGQIFMNHLRSHCSLIVLNMVLLAQAYPIRRPFGPTLTTKRTDVQHFCKRSWSLNKLIPRASEDQETDEHLR